MCSAIFKFLRAVAGLGAAFISTIGPAFATDVNGVQVVDGNGGGTIANPWAITGHLFVGNASDGDLTVQNGASVTVTGNANLGYSAAMRGSLSVIGTGSTFVVDSALFAGWDGPGEIEIRDGGAVSSSFSCVGCFGNASALVSGLGSQWSLNGGMSVGADANGELLMTNGAQVSNDYLYVGSNAGAVGTVTVSGAGSSLVVGDDVFVGDEGTGTLSIRDGATLTSGEAIIGFEVGSSGTVSLTGTGSSWAMAEDLTIGIDGAGELTIGDAAALTVASGSGSIYLANTAGSQGKLTVGANLGSSASAAGSVDARELVFGNGSGDLIFNHSSDHYVWATDISGSGTITNAAGTTNLTGDLSAFSGTAAISGGTLSVDGIFAGSMFVDNGGVLAGSGTISNVVLASGATVAPGNSIGTLNIVGPFSLVSGTTLEIEVDSLGNSDRVVSTGAITIDAGSTLLVLAENGTDTGASYQPATVYTILQGTSLTGSFGTISENFAFLDGTVSYDSANAYLTLTRDDDLLFQSKAETENQRNVATAISAQGSGVLFDAILVLPDGAPPAAFDALSGEIHGDILTGVSRQNARVRNVLRERAHTASTSTERTSPVSAYLPLDRVLNAEPLSSTTFWSSVLGTFSDIDGDGNSHGHKAASSGFVVGADRDFGDGWYAGVAAGYDELQIKQHTLDSDAAIDSYHLALYGGRRIGSLGLSWGTVSSWSAIDASRRVRFPGFSDDVRADYASKAVEAHLEAGWKTSHDLMTVEPFGAASFTHISRGSFDETGGAAALSAATASENFWETTLGFRIDRDIAVNSMLGKLRASLGWTHAFGDELTEVGMRLSTGGDHFRIKAAGNARNVIFIRAGAKLQIAKRASVDLNYQMNYSSGHSDHSLAAKLDVSF